LSLKYCVQPSHHPVEPGIALRTFSTARSLGATKKTQISLSLLIRFLLRDLVELLSRYSNREELLKPLVRALKMVETGEPGEEVPQIESVVHPPRLLKDRLSEADIASMVELYQSGWTAVALGERFGISARSVRRVMKVQKVRKR
jgi:hypothetical protein